MRLKPKICKCGKKALPNRRICWSCELARRHAKREASVARLKARKQAKQTRVANSLPQLKKKAWKAISLYVRQKGMDSNEMNSCFTCGAKRHWKDLHTGHLFHGRLDYDPRNLRPQCGQCNIYLSGNGAVFALKMTEEIGVDGMKALLLEANTKVYSTQDLKNVIAKYSTPLN